MRTKTLWIIALALIIAVAGCGPNDEDVPGGYTGEDDFITIASESGETEISVADLMALEAITEEIIKTDDAGEVEEQYPIKGVLLETVLEHLEIDADNLDTVRFTAGDGYSVEVPAAILANSKLILAYEIDGDPLFDDTRPIRMFIPGQESMYWVKKTVKITLNMDESQDPGDQGQLVDKILFFESMELEEIDYTDEEGARAVETSDVLKDVETSPQVYMLASDGFDKNEETDTFLENYIVVQGDNAPAFRGPNLPRGMHVKDLVYMATGDTGFLFVEKALEYFDDVQVQSDSGISLKELVDTLGLKEADTYSLEAADGYSVEVSSEDLEAGIVYIRESGEVASAFEELPKNTAVKNLLFIRTAE